MSRLLSTILIFMAFSGMSLAQTCCSGGVPVSGNLGLPPGDHQTLQLSLNYDLNYLDTWRRGSKVDDLLSGNTVRTTQSIILKLGYNFTERFSVEGFLPWVRQEIFSRENPAVIPLVSKGVGDAILMLKYRVFSIGENTTTFHIAAGPKFPTGSSSKTNGGAILNADLQPGSGSWDAVFWGQINHVTVFRPSMSVFATASYALKGRNNNYLNLENSWFQFGDELMISAGVSDRLLIGQTIFDPSLNIRYRNTPQDVLTGRPQISTGGSFIFLAPGLAYWISKDLSVSGTFEFPLYATVGNLQVTPTYRLNVGIFYRLSFNKEKITIDPF